MKITTTVLTSVCIMFFASCASVSPHVSVATQDAESWIDPLDVKLSQVSLSRVRMSSALVLISNTINSSSQVRSHFVWYGPRFPSLEEAKRIPDPFVTLEASNITLRSVLDTLCSQSGWAYEKGVKGIDFTIPWRRKAKTGSP
jgi:hypothetical protein